MYRDQIRIFLYYKTDNMDALINSSFHTIQKEYLKWYFFFYEKKQLVAYLHQWFKLVHFICPETPIKFFKSINWCRRWTTTKLYTAIILKNRRKKDFVLFSAHTEIIALFNYKSFFFFCIFKAPTDVLFNCLTANIWCSGFC